MQRIELPERPDWRQTAESLGFTFHSMYGEPYWDETAAYCFTLRQIEDDIEDPTTELHQMCLSVVDDAVKDEETLSKLAIPPQHWDLIAESWRTREPSLYGRFDLAYTGDGPAKMLEYNADTPTSLYESAYFQWLWLEDRLAAGVLPAGADQFNSLQEQLIARMGVLWPEGGHVHFAACRGSEEDRQTVRYLEDCAEQAGIIPHFVHMEDIGVDVIGRLCDADANVIGALFKLYPWEMMLRDEAGAALAGAGCMIVEPPWKAVLSNKGLLALLWRRYRNHPNLLPAFFWGEANDDLPSDYVRKPLYSREGDNIAIVRQGQDTVEADGEYGAEGFIAQSYTPLPTFQRADGGTVHTVLGSWIVGDAACGLAVREDAGPITRNLSRFLPHWIAPS